METQVNFTPQSNERILGNLWSKYFPFWPLYVMLILVSLGATWFYLQNKLPVFESTAKLLVKDEKKGTEDAKMTESLNMLSSKKIIENEIEVIKSRAIMGKVVNQLQLYAPLYEKEKWKDKPAYALSPIKIEVRSPDSLFEVERVDFKYDVTKSLVSLNGQSYSLNQWHRMPWGDLRFISNSTNYLKNKSYYFSLVNPKRVARGILIRLEVLPSGKLSTIINLSLKDEEPRRSEDILNALVIAYDNASLSEKNVLAENTLTFLDDRLKFVSADLDSIEKQLQQYRARKGAIDLSSQGKMFLQNVSDNDQKLSDVNMKLAVLKQVEQYVFSNDSKGGLVPSTLGVEDPQLSNLLNRLYDTEMLYEKKKRTTGENNPELTSLADQIERIKPGVLSNIRGQQQSLEVTKRNLYSTNGAYASLLHALPQQERDLVEINREQNIKSTLYSFLLQKREETALSYSSVLSDTKLIDKAESTFEPVGISNKIIYGAAIVIALILGIVIITFRELFNRTILFRQEIESVTSFPVIGEIALEKSKAPLVIEDGRGSFIAEEFRMLRTSLFYLGINAGGKKILITSTISGEGKSFVAVNLAMSLALTGKKVILVEFDLSNPTLLHKLGMQEGFGVANYLAGDIEAEDIIRETQVNANLFIMAAGTLPPNPSDLMLKDRTAELLDHLSKRFDFVIVDSAPAGIISDAYILSRHCDATLYVVRHNHTPKKMLERLDHNNKINKLKNLAIVFNGVRSRGFGKSGYPYGYGYGYVYGTAKNNSMKN